MKNSLLLLVILVACAKESSTEKKSLQKKTIPALIEEITDPLVSSEQQQQTDGDFVLNRPYNGTNVVLNHNSRQRLGMIRIKGKDAEKLHKYMALATIKVKSPHVKSELEAKVGTHVSCRPDACWMYIDFKNGDVRDNETTSGFAKAPKIILTYKGENLKLEMFGRRGKIFFEGMDAKALYSVMAVADEIREGKGSSTSKKAGDGIECMKTTSGENIAFKCEVEFNHRTGAMKTVSND